jgi:L-2-hydroxyglutarate oxidase
MRNFDIIIIGAGLVGLASGYALMRRNPRMRICVLEKEDRPAAHQSGHNSGVLHSGVYYKPGSEKARNCLVGKQLLEQFCITHNIAFQTTGKLVIASNAAELPALQTIFERATANGAAVTMIEQEGITEIEPHAVGVKALHVPETGIVDFKGVAEKLTQLLTQGGNEVLFQHQVTKAIAGQELILQGQNFEYQAKLVINCAGLHADRVARLLGCQTSIQIVPFRGEYYQLKQTREHLCRGLIYPVPDLRFPFLGIHFTRMVKGGVEVGPNAVLAYAREGYSHRIVNLKDLKESLTFKGTRSFLWKHLGRGFHELLRSLSRTAFAHSAQKLVPEVTSTDLEPCGAGVRAQALTPQGALVDDFWIERHENVMNVLNAPSPAATACLSIGETIAKKAL